MDEYIKRDDVLDLLANRDVVINPNDEVANIREDVECLPAAAVRPVVRGRWKKVGTQMHLNLDNAREQYRELGYPHRNIECLQCSNCRKVSMVDESIRYEFCPHCGADMREEADV